MSEPETPTPRGVESFLDEPTRDLADWRWLWSEDVDFPVRGRGGPLGALVVAAKRALRPLGKLILGDRLDRQRTWNLIALEHLQRLEARRRELADRLENLDAFVREGLKETLEHNDALYTRADQKLDRYRHETRDLAAALGAALAAVEAAEPAEPAAPGPSGEGGGGETRGPGAEPLAAALDERAYLELERRYRGTEEEIAERLRRYRPWLESLPAGRPVLDLGCGRGEALDLLAELGVPGRGVDANARMVERCRERGLQAEQGDLFAALEAAGEGELGGVVSFHVVEHLPPAAVGRLVHLAWRALAPGGVLILETPNPLSVVVAARSFWLDPTHVRPVHPETLGLLCELAGFAAVEHLELRPFPESQRLPELDLAALSETQHALADRVNRLRDHLDDLLYGHQDYAVVATKG